MPQFPLPIAKECMAKYDELMRGDDVPKMHNAFSDTVTFNTKDLADWLTTNNYLQNTDSIRVCFGVYTPDAAQAAGKEEEEGRVTVFICPIRNGEEIDCFNGGSNGP
jgi:hypothetical protein